MLGSLAAVAVWEALTLNVGFALPLLSISVEGLVAERLGALAGHENDLASVAFEANWAAMGTLPLVGEPGESTAGTDAIM